jgi:hypothetical protein
VEKNIICFGDLTATKNLLSPEQAILFEEFSQAREAFSLLPKKMLAIRGGKEWNVANT